MQKRYQIDKQRAVQQFRRLATETNPDIQMILPLAGIEAMLQEGVGHLMREAGLLLRRRCATFIITTRWRENRRCRRNNGCAITRNIASR